MYIVLYYTTTEQKPNKNDEHAWSVEGINIPKYFLQ